MLYGILSVRPTLGSGDPALAIDIDDLRCTVEGENIETHKHLCHLAEVNAEITIVGASMENDVTERQDEFPGGYIIVREFYAGHLTYDASVKFWRKPDGSCFVADSKATNK